MELLNKNTSRAKKLALCGVFTALIMLLTFLHIPIGYGYINLGDAMVFVAAVFIGWWALPAAAVGSALGDLVLGYALYMIPTFIIKGLMALIVVLLTRKNSGFWMCLLAFTLASLFMQGGYVLAEYALTVMLYLSGDGVYVFVAVTFLLGLIQSAASIPAALIICRLLRAYRPPPPGDSI